MEVEFQSAVANLLSTDVEILKNLTLEPWAQRKVTVRAKGMDRMCFSALLERLKAGASKGVLCARGFPEFWNGNSEILIVNASSKRTRLCVGDSVGKVSLETNDEEESYISLGTLDFHESKLTSAAGQGSQYNMVCTVAEHVTVPEQLDLTSARQMLSRTEFGQLMTTLRENHAVWRCPDEKLGAGERFAHCIETGEARPINAKPRRLPPVKVNAAYTEVQRMLDMDVIEPTNSPWAAPIVLVTKKDGSIRFCVDYRKLNEVTKVDSYPLPRCDDLLGSLHGKKYFSALDLESGYWQIPMAQADKEKTAFVTPFGAWQFKVMPFGLRNAPSTFQRTMDMVLAGAKWNHCLVYIDDILIFSETVDNHIRDIHDVFSRLVKYNLKLKPSKCDLFKHEIMFLGHLISEHGIKPNPARTSAIMSWPEPKTCEEVQSFLGTCSYYRKFILNFSLLAKPLFDIVHQWEWGQAQSDAFKLLRFKLSNPPLLKHPRPLDPFIVETDASRIGLGAVLLQANQEGVEQPVEYASRLLRKHERNYAVRELEALGILWACETFRHWVLHQKFLVRTDHQSLQALDKVQDGRLERWRTRLSPFLFSIEYKRGKHHVVPDGLSRCGVDARPELVHSEELTDEMTLFTSQASRVGLSEIRQHQKIDKELLNISEFLMSGAIPKNTKSKQARFAEHASNFTIRDGILYRGDCIVLPKTLRSPMLDELHSQAHFGADKLLPGIRTRFWWTGLAKDVRAFCTACVQCARATPYNSERLGKLQPIKSAGPWLTVAMDLAGPYPEGEEDERYVMVIMDHFTKYVLLIGLRSKQASVVARKVHKHLICIFGCPQTIITDNGSEFKGEFDVLCNELSINHSCVLPYHQQANGLVERYMQSLNKIIRIVTSERKQSWSRALCLHAFAYNSSYHAAIMNTPYFLNFGRDPRIPIDNRMQLEELDEGVRLRTFGRNKACEMAGIMAWTAERLQDYQASMKQRYDASQRNVEVLVGDIVLVRREGILPKTVMRWSKPCRVVNADKDGLELSVKPLFGQEAIQTVALQRVRPYHPSALNPLWTSSAPPQELNGLPIVDDLVDSEEESGSFALVDVSNHTNPLVHGSPLTGDIRKRCLPVQGVDALSPLENGDLVSPLVCCPQDVRKSHAEQTTAITEGLLPSHPKEVPDSLEVSGETIRRLPDSTDGITPPESTESIGDMLPVMGIESRTSGTLSNSEIATGEPAVADTPGRTKEFSSNCLSPQPTGDTPLEEEEFLIDSLVDCRIQRGYPYYKVRWTGYGPEHDSWEPIWELPEHTVRTYDAERARHNPPQRSLRRPPRNR